MNISRQKYYYLIAGLPGLSLADSHLPFTAKAFLDDLRNKMGSRDFELVCWLYYQIDNRNLLNILESKNSLLHFEGRYSLEELEKGIEGNCSLPPYMNDFISVFKENKSHYNEAEWEAKLTEAYFKEAMKTGNKVLEVWIEFELNLKNLILVMGNLKKAFPFPEIVIKANEIAIMMKENPSADFSAQPYIDFMNQVMIIIETENLIEREKKIDLLRWKKLEEMTLFYYFTIETILSFIVKLMILERWAILKKQPGNDFLPIILNSFTDKIKMPTAENL